MRVFRRPIHAGFALIALSATFIAGCGHHATRVNTPLAPARVGSTETGVASWYGVPYDGRRAASGEIYDMRQLTAAHRQLPFQTWVEVTNLSNGKQVDVRINDRGPFVKGRIVDLSQAAARDIDMLRAGTARVRLRVIPPPREPAPKPVEITAAPAAPLLAPATPATESAVSEAAPPVTVPPLATAPVVAPLPAAASSATLAPTAGYAVQAGAFSDHARAESLRVRLQEVFGEARIAPLNGRAPLLWRVIVGRQITREQASELAIRVRRETGSAIVVPELQAPAAVN